jgi:hypothetical protein
MRCPHHIQRCFERIRLDLAVLDAAAQGDLGEEVKTARIAVGDLERRAPMARWMGRKWTGETRREYRAQQIEEQQRDARGTRRKGGRR